MKTTFILFGLFFSVALLSQNTETEQFQVIGAGEELIGAHVYFYDGKELLYTDATDIDGQVRLHPNSTWVRITYLGFEDWEGAVEEIRPFGQVELLQGITLATVEVLVVATRVEVDRIICNYPYGEHCYEVQEIVPLEEEVEEAEVEDPPLSIKVYPNPSPSVVYIEGEHLQGLVELYTLDGRLVEQINVQHGQAQFDLSSRGAGMYLLVQNGKVLGKVMRSARYGSSPFIPAQQSNW